MRVIDLSSTIYDGYPVYPGDKNIKISTIANHADNGWQVMKLSIGTHSGTHIDMPLHIIENGENTSDFPLEKLMGNAITISIPKDQNEKIIVDEIKTANINAGDIVLIHTGWDKYNGSPEFFSDFPFMDDEAADYLIEKEIKAIGTDIPSFDSLAKGTPIHRKLLEARIPIIECLINLEQIVDKKATFIAFPLKIANADGSPVRAVALV